MVALKTSLQDELSSLSSQSQSASGRAAAHITLPDGSVREFDHPTTAKEVASAIGPGLARAAVAAMVEGKVMDINAPLKGQVNLRILTAKDPEGLEVIRHSTAHLMAYAVQELFPEARVTIGPVIDDGFYYDFAVPHHFTPEDLQRIEMRMKELAQEDHPVSREVWERDQAIEHFREVKEPYKIELISAIPQNEVISFYRMGEFLDLCRGPHVPSCSHLKVFKLMKVAGAYWRGDHRNEMLQRIYGTAWATDAEQQTYLHRLEEAEKRDHRRLGRQLDLFRLHEEAPGMVFWHPQGHHLWRSIEGYMRGRLQKEGYQEVRTPMMMDRSLWERSGHWAMFGENMYTTESESRHFAVKPMNCPGHVLIYNSDVHSYRDLPLRMAEFGSCHRNEPSGSLHGLMRVRAFVQDDAHIFCTPDQIQSESTAFMRLLQSIYVDFGFSEIEVRLSTRPAKRMGTDEAWDKAEDALAQALKQQNLSYKLQPGEGAFYGPKVEFSLKDSLGRLWQCGTLQLDFVLPDRLGAEYVGEDNNRHTPVMLHRAVLGSLERFIGILIEHYGGAFPLWLAPVQVVVVNISESQADYAKKIAHALENQGFRVTADLRSEKITYKIREHALAKRPYLVIVGDKEKEEGRVSVRARSDVDLNNLVAAPRKDRRNEASMVAPEALIEHLQRQVLEMCRGNSGRVASSN